MADISKVSPARRGLRIFIPIAVALVFAAAGIAAIGAVRKPDPFGTHATATPPLVVQVKQVELVDAYTIVHEYVGEVEAARQSRIGFEIGGQIRAVMAEEGERVETGHPLAKLDTDRLAARRQELVAARDQALAERELAKLTKQRVGEAHELNAVSSLEWDEARQNYDARAAAAERANAAIASIDVELAKSELTAPYDAVVHHRFVDEGDVVTAGQPVLELLEWTQPEARVGVSRDAAERLSPGDTTTLLIHGRSFDAVVKAVLPVRGERTRTVDVILRLDADLNTVRAGDLVVLPVEREVRETGAWLPLAGLSEGARGLWSCYVVESNEETGTNYEVTRREVEVLHQEENRVFVRGTLSEDERVVVEGAHRLTPGLTVRIEEGDAS